MAEVQRAGAEEAAKEAEARAYSLSATVQVRRLSPCQCEAVGLHFGCLVENQCFSAIVSRPIAKGRNSYTRV